MPPSENHAGPAGDPADLTIPIANNGGEHRASDIVDAGFLQLVRLGFLAPDHPLVTDTLRLVDRELKVDFAPGPCWRRYQFDGYGSHPDGRPFDGSCYGGCWPLLTGERGHYELAAGSDPTPYLKAMEGFANEGGMFPEQIWPLQDVGRLQHGKSAGSSMPLCWAHAEYISLVHSLRAGYPLDRIPEAWQRYVEGPAPEIETVFWSLAHRTESVAAGNSLGILLDHPALIHWKTDDQGDWKETRAAPLFCALHMPNLGPVHSGVRFAFDDSGESHRVRAE